WAETAVAGPGSRRHRPSGRRHQRGHPRRVVVVAGRRELAVTERVPLDHRDATGTDRSLDLEVVDRADLVAVLPLPVDLNAAHDRAQLRRALKERRLAVHLETRAFEVEVVGEQLGGARLVAGGE